MAECLNVIDAAKAAAAPVVELRTGLSDGSVSQLSNGGGGAQPMTGGGQEDHHGLDPILEGQWNDYAWNELRRGVELVARPMSYALLTRQIKLNGISQLEVDGTNSTGLLNKFHRNASL